MKRILVNLLLVSTIGLVGCSTNTQNENTGIGALTGAAIGGIGVGALGGTGWGIGAGIIGGALIGGLIGHSMDSSDNSTTYTVIQNNPTNKTSTWVNHKTGVTYTMTPTSGFFTVKGNPNCREYHFTSTKDGKTSQRDGAACLTSDGKWHSVRK